MCLFHKPSYRIVHCTVLFLMVVVNFILIYQFLFNEDVVIGNGEEIDLAMYEPFEPLIAEGFPVSIDHASLRIPKIIHQTWRDTHVPSEFSTNIRTFVKYNSGFQYYFWTDESGRNLIKERHPTLMNTFDNYVEGVRKADMLRYVVLYEFGGIYADLDTECLRPLENVLNKYTCIISPEPYEHSALIYNTEFMVTNSIMFCKAKHPFLKQLIYNLPDFSHFSQDIDSSGPNYMTYIFKKYSEELHVQKINDELHEHSVFVASSQYFQSNLDPVRFDQFRKMCKDFAKLNKVGKRGCVSLLQRGMVRRKSLFAYTKHFFSHTGKKLVENGKMAIQDIVHHVNIYNTVI